MTAQELKDCVKLARERSAQNKDVLDLSVFHFFALKDFKPVVVTKELVADLIRWQCFQLNGEINMEYLQEIRKYGRKRFLIV